MTLVKNTTAVLHITGNGQAVNVFSLPTWYSEHMAY